MRKDLNFFKADEKKLFDILESLGGKASHGECSFGFSFELKDGRTIIIGASDDDVVGDGNAWIKIFKERKINN